MGLQPSFEGPPVGVDRKYIAMQSWGAGVGRGGLQTLEGWDGSVHCAHHIHSVRANQGLSSPITHFTRQGLEAQQKNPGKPPVLPSMNSFSCQAGHGIKMRGHDDAQSGKVRLQSHEVRFLNPTRRMTLDTLPSLSFFTWEMAAWM